MKCPGCATSFKEGEKLVMQGLHIEYKNYNLPIKDQKPARTLLKTIVSFLNSKGGTIYIGVEDSKGEVKGVVLEEQGREQFVTFVKGLTKRIRPEVTCSTSDAQIKLQFVPVVGKKQFQGKYLAKLIVKQGDPARIYCFGHKIKIENGPQAITHQMFYSYFRHNMGGLQELKGVNLLKQIRNRAQNPLKATTIFHSGCNPEPLNLQETSYVISIVPVSADEFKSISQLFKEQLSILDVDFKAVHNNQRQALEVKFEDFAQFQKVKGVIQESLGFVNEESRTYKFKIKRSKKKELTLSKNQKFKPQKDEDEETKTEKTEEVLAIKTELVQEVKKNDLKPSNNLKRESRKERNSDKAQHIKQKEEKSHQPTMTEMKQELSSSSQNTPKKNPSNFPKKYSLTFTYLDFRKTHQFCKFLQMINPGLKFELTLYNNSLELFFLNNEDKEVFNQQAVQFQKQMKPFSFKQRGVAWGTNTSILAIDHFDINKKQMLQQELKIMMKNQLAVSTFFQKENNGRKGKKAPQSLMAQMSRPDFACKWLDRLLEDKKWKNKYSIPGKGHKIAKMTVIMILENGLREEIGYDSCSSDECEQYS